MIFLICASVAAFALHNAEELGIFAIFLTGTLAQVPLAAGAIFLANRLLEILGISASPGTGL